MLTAVDGLAVRHGGAVGACESLRVVPGVVHVSLHPFSGLTTVDHDLAVCSFDQLSAALDAPAEDGPAG